MELMVGGDGAHGGVMELVGELWNFRGGDGACGRMMELLGWWRSWRGGGARRG